MPGLEEAEETTEGLGRIKGSVMNVGPNCEAGKLEGDPASGIIDMLGGNGVLNSERSVGVDVGAYPTGFVRP